MYQQFALVLLAYIALTFAAKYDEILEKEWKAYKLTFNKKYADEMEESIRYKIFKENKLKVAEHNVRYVAGEEVYELGINQFADLLETEFCDAVAGLSAKPQLSLNLLAPTFITAANVIVPESVDWRKHGAVTEVKTQVHCGSCSWAFSVTGALEGQHYRKSQKLISLSEQNLLECAQSHGNQNDNIISGYGYIKKNNGIDTEKSYPYSPKKDSCHFKPHAVGARITGYTKLPEGDETKLMAAVATIGPISVIVDAAHNSFQLYKGGIYDAQDCQTNHSNHAMLVVGFGSDEHGKDYWIAKNSWGKRWGEKGYIRIARNKNKCGISSFATYPLV